MKKIGFMICALLILLSHANAQTECQSVKGAAAPSSSKQETFTSGDELPTVRLTYKIQGLRSESDAQTITKLLSSQPYVIECAINWREENLQVIVHDEDYAYKIKDFILDNQSSVGGGLFVNFLQAIYMQENKPKSTDTKNIK